MVGTEQHLAPEFHRHRHLVRRCPIGKRGGSIGLPSAAAQDKQRALRLVEYAFELLPLSGCGCHFGGVTGRCVGHGGHFGEHVFG